jgi:bifunctional non-homologous end joining protein LigD
MSRRATRGTATRRPPPADHPTVARQLAAIERRGGDGELVFAAGLTLAVSSLDKPFFPSVGLTKGGLMRYYARVAPALLPAIDGRPLALKRYPDGVDGPSFFQHDPGRAPPDAVRLARVAVEHGPPESRYVGGDLRTLLHTVQLGTIAVNAWHSRVSSIDTPDYCVLDLDPGPDAPFARIVRVAAAVRDALAERGHAAALKTSGSRGLHLLVPLPPDATYARSAALAEEVAHAVAAAHPAEATVERALGARDPGQVYVDHLQNAHGKTLAAVFSVRARPGATVSAPVSWAQLARPGFDPGAFTAATVPKRLLSLNRRWVVSLTTSNPAAGVGGAALAGGTAGRSVR